MWGFRKSDETNSELGDPGAAVPLHYNVKYLTFSNNIIFNSNRGIQITDPLLKLSYSLEDSNISENKLIDIKETGIILVAGKDNIISKNLLKNFPENTNNTYWLAAYKSLGNKIINNIITDTMERSARFADYINLNSFSNNQYYKSTNGDIPASGGIIDMIDPTENYRDFTFTADKYTNNPRTITIQKIIYDNTLK